MRELTGRSQSGRQLCTDGSYCPPRGPRGRLFPGTKKREGGKIQIGEFLNWPSKIKMTFDLLRMPRF